MTRAPLLLAVLAAALLAPATARADDKAQCLAASDDGQSQRDDGKYRRAREAFATCSRDVCPTLVRRDCTKWLAELSQSWPSVVVSAKDDKGADLVGVTVRMDGEVLASKLDGKPTQVDPGSHTFRFEASGFPAVEQQVVVHAGEKSRLLAVQFGSAPAAASSGAKGETSSDGASTTEGSGEGAADTSHTPAGTRASAWVFAGLSLAAFGAGAYFGLSGLGDRSNLQSQPCAKTSSCPQSSVDSIKTKYTVADIALGVGVVSAGLSVYLFLAAPSPNDPAKASAIDVVATPGGAQLTYGGRF
jgi:hypothetical protein